jgi:3-keto-disaccharide hydrolase
MERRTFLKVSLAPGLCLWSLDGQKLPDIYHEEAHGDPVFLLEPGWRPLLNAKDVSGWHSMDGSRHEWFTSRAVIWKRIWNPKYLVATHEPGDRLVNGDTGKTANLVTDDKFGSFQLYLEFMTARGSNSGVYLHGLYEVQIFDSFGYTGPLMVGDCGGIYEREHLAGGSPPALNASRPPGEWQSFRIWFEAPRFDSTGKKIANAKARRVLLNEQVVQQNVELPGPTVSAMKISEAPTNPIMLQGDHGPIAFRNIQIKDFAPQP